MDFIIGLLESRRKRHVKPYNAILVVVDRYTKRVRYFPCHDSLDVIGLAEIIARKLVLRGAGIPQSIMSDRGPQFMSKFWAAFCYHLRINRWLTTAYHPQMDRQTEWQNQTLEQYLRAYVNYLQDHWVYWLPLAEFAYNNSVQASTDVTPFYAEKGFHPSIEATVQAIPADGTVPDVPDARAHADRLVELRAAIEQRWKEVTTTQRKYADRRTRPREFAVGDMVWLSGKNIRTKRPSKKLDHRFYGPYPVVERIGSQDYCLKLSQHVGSIHNVFHVSLLEPYVSDGRCAPEPPPPIEVDSEEEYELEEILQSAYRYNSFCYRVKYKEYSAEESEWLPAENLRDAPDMVWRFHETHLNQPKPPGWGTRSRPGARRLNATNIVVAAGKPTLHYK
jgi:hypothetical protein